MPKRLELSGDDISLLTREVSHGLESCSICGCLDVDSLIFRLFLCFFCPQVDQVDELGSFNLSLEEALGGLHLCGRFLLLL